MTEAKQSPHGTRAQSGAAEPPPGDDAPSDPARTLSPSARTPSPAERTPSPAGAQVASLAAGFREQLCRALDVELPEEPSALAYVDHYLSLLREETREPILALIAAGAGAWFGELVRREVGATWVGDGSEPRRLRLLLEPAFLHFSPVDLAYEAIFSGPAGEDDPRLPAGAELDASFHLRKRPDPAPDPAAGPTSDRGDDELPSEHDWVAARLAETAPLPEDQFHSLTGRFETLTLILELLANRHHDHGREPTRYHLNDYLAALTGEG